MPTHPAIVWLALAAWTALMVAYPAQTAVLTAIAFVISQLWEIPE